jgi:chromosome segregation ATPase
MTLPANKKTLPERIDKTLDWLETSRDSWKNKAKIAKEELKKRTLAVKRARESRNEFKEQLEQAKEAHCMHQEELNQKTIEIEKLEKQLAEARSEIEELKKKPLRL